MNSDILVNCEYGADDAEKATIAITLANVASTKEGRARVFLTGEAVKLVTPGGADGLQAAGYRAVADLMKSYIDNGGRFWVCKACADAKRLTASDLIPSATLAGASDTIAFLRDGAILLK